MVFGFGKKKTEVQPAPTQREREVTLQEIPSLIKELESPKISTLLQEAKRLKSGVESNQKSIHETILQLESDDLKLDEVDKNLKTIGKRGKDAVVATIKKETKTRLVNIERYEDVVELNNEINQILKRMGDILGLHTRVMHVFARKYADKLKEEISELAQNRNSLQRLISEQEEFRSNANSIDGIIEKIHELKEQLGQKTHRVNEIINEKNETIKTIGKLEREISEVRSSLEYNQFLEIKKKIDSFSQEKSEIRDRIGAQFSKISRPLNKYSYVSSFDRPMKKLLEELIADPYQAISIENKGPITEILQAVTKSIVAGNVSVKDSDKSAELVEETIERLDEFLALKAGYAKKISELEFKLKIFDSKKIEEKEADLERMKSNLIELEKSYEKLEKEISENRIHVGALKQELEKVLGQLMKVHISANIQS